jgi:uncharacterized phage infection (PIP) family protein YhgE
LPEEGFYARHTGCNKRILPIDGIFSWEKGRCMKMNKIFLVVMALSLAIGLLGGYRIWGVKDHGEADIKQLLEKVNEEVEVIETRNRDLAAALEAAKEDIGKSESLKTENQELKKQLQISLQEKKELENALEEVRRKESEDRRQAETEKELRTLNDGLKERITVLENEKRDLKELKALSDDLQGRISELEKENQELKSVIDKISDMTQREEETRKIETDRSPESKEGERNGDRN